MIRLPFFHGSSSDLAQWTVELAEAANMAADDKAERAGFINETQFQVGLGEFFEEVVDGLEGSADDAVAAHFGGVLRGDRDGDGFFVDVQADVMHDLFMGVWFRYMVINDPASCRISNCTDRSASADNPRLQPQSNTRSSTLLSHMV